MKILFLDVDGVLNIMSSSYYTYRYGKKIEDHLVRRLEFILERVPDVYIVVSSSWGMKDTKIELEKHDFKYLNRIIDRTSRTKRYRGEQIYDYIINNNNLESICVLEDEPDDICGTRCNLIDESFVVKVDMDNGLSHENCIKAIRILNKINESRHSLNVKYTDISYETYYNKGYRPQVCYNPKKDKGRWKYIKLDNNDMLMHLHN